MKYGLARRLLAVVVIAAMGGGFLAACGGDDGATDASDNGDVTTTTTRDEESTTTTFTTETTDSTLAEGSATTIAETGSTLPGGPPTTTKPRATTTTARRQASPTTIKKATRQIEAPAGATPTTVRPRPTDVNADGELVIGYAAPPNTLDPAKNSLVVYLFPLYDRLTMLDANLAVQPMLATGWTFPNKSTFEMTLRDDVVFEDGTKFDATAVKVNIERSKTLSGSLLASLLKNISSVEAVNPTLVRFHLSAGGTELPSLFAAHAGMMISPKVIARGVSLDISTRGGGSGPYTVDSTTIGDRVVYKQSKTVQDGTYWDKRAGLLKKLTWLFVTTSPQRINAVRSGDVDLAQVTGIDTYPAQQLIDKGELKGVRVSLETINIVMMMRSTRGILANLQFRQALQYAIDKEALSKGLYNGHCTPSSQFFTKNHWAHSFVVDGRYRYDQAQAQKMIKDTGIFNPTFTAQASPIYSAPAQALQGILGDYGINMKIENIQATDVSFRDGNADAMVGVMSGNIDPTNVLGTFYLPTGVFKLYTDADGSVTRDASVAADPTLSQAQAAKIFDGIWQKIAEQSVAIHLCNSHQVYIHKGKVANLGDFGALSAGAADARYLYVRK